MKKGFKTSLLAVLLFTFLALVGKSSISAVMKEQNTQQEELKYIRLFMEAYQLVKEKYVEENY